MEALLRASVAPAAATGSSVYRNAAAANTPGLWSRPALVVWMVRGSMFLLGCDIIHKLEGIGVSRITIL